MESVIRCPTLIFQQRKIYYDWDSKDSIEKYQDILLKYYYGTLICFFVPESDIRILAVRAPSYFITFFVEH